MESTLVRDCDLKVPSTQKSWLFNKDIQPFNWAANQGWYRKRGNREWKVRKVMFILSVLPKRCWVFVTLYGCLHVVLRKTSMRRVRCPITRYHGCATIWKLTRGRDRDQPLVRETRDWSRTTSSRWERTCQTSSCEISFNLVTRLTSNALLQGS